MKYNVNQSWYWYFSLESVWIGCKDWHIWKIDTILVHSVAGLNNIPRPPSLNTGKTILCYFYVNLTLYQDLFLSS